MAAESVVLACPNCGAPADPGVGQCDNCRYLHIGKLKRLAPIQAGSVAEDPRTGPANQSTGESTSPENNGLVLVGWITAILLPIVGLVIGVVVSNRGDKRGGHITIAAVTVTVASILMFAILILAASAQAANEYELNDTRDSAYGPLAGGTAYTAGIETLNDEDWYLFYIKTYSQMDFSATMVKTSEFEDAVRLSLYDKDGLEVDSFRAGYLNITKHRLLTMSAGRYYIRVEAADAGPGDRYRFRIDPAASITTSRECGEAIVARDSIAPQLTTANEELAEVSAKLATKAAAVHEAKKELRQASSKAKRLKLKATSLAERKDEPRKFRKWNRTRAKLRRARGDVERAVERFEDAKAERRPVWNEKLSLEGVVVQHQQAIAVADGQIATYC